MTMPTLSVKRIKVNESTFCVRNLSKRFMETSYSCVIAAGESFALPEILLLSWNFFIPIDVAAD
jgi:hypothetical protein